MKVIVAGSRKNIPTVIVDAAIEHFRSSITSIVCGGARGVDTAGLEYGCANNIAIEEFPADWEADGKAAGPMRNAKMALHADALILVWDGESPGSAHMKKTMLALNKPVFEVIVRRHGDWPTAI